MGSEESTLQEEETAVPVIAPNDPIETAIAKLEALKRSTSTSATPPCATPTCTKPPPRRGSLCRNSWTCCKCKHVNKSGKWHKCQNPSPAPLAKVLPGVDQKQCRHDRCIDCLPIYFAPQPGTESSEVRRWSTKGMSNDAKTMQMLYCKLIARKAMEKEVGDIILAKKEERRLHRDSLTGYRVGEWPGGF
jgi:hypothetical protein